MHESDLTDKQPYKMEVQDIINILSKHTTEVDNFNSAVFSQDFEAVANEILKQVKYDFMHSVSNCLKCEPMEYDVKGIRYFKCKHCGKEMK